LALLGQSAVREEFYELRKGPAGLQLPHTSAKIRTFLNLRPSAISFIPKGGKMAETQQNLHTGTSAQPYRVDQKLHQILYKPESRPSLEPTQEVLPEPVYPQHPDPVPMTSRDYQLLNAKRTWKTWGAPYFRSRWHSKELRPIIPYLFTEWKCNLDCHYCWSYNNAVKGMTEDVAKRSIDWLHSIGSRVLALMGGEPLLRPKFIHKIVDYSAKRDIFVY
jgi:sulfatase maturation enzyme AslB (radical SAM superfamily)